MVVWTILGLFGSTHSPTVPRPCLTKQRRSLQKRRLDHTSLLICVANRRAVLVGWQFRDVLYWDSLDPRQGPEPRKNPHFPSPSHDTWKREFSVKKSPFSLCSLVEEERGFFGGKLPFPGRGEMGVFGPRNPLFQEMGMRGPVWGRGNAKSKTCSYRTSRILQSLQGRFRSSPPSLSWTSQVAGCDSCQRCELQLIAYGRLDPAQNASSRGPILVGNGPNTVSESTVSNTELSEFFCPRRIPGRELSEFLSAYCLCDKANSPIFSQNSPSLPQNSVRLSEFSSPKQYSRNSTPPVSQLGTRWPFTGVSGPPGPKPWRSLKKVSRGLRPQDPWESGKSLEKVFLDLFETFFQTLRRLFQRLLRGFGPGGPERPL